MDSKSIENIPDDFINKGDEEILSATQKQINEWNKFLLDLNNKMVIQNCNILLLIDNCSVHKLLSSTILTNIQIYNLLPRTTSHLQPCDASIIHSFKAHYRKLFVDNRIQAYDAIGNNISDLI